MQFLTALFGGAENTLLTTVFALGAVLALILLGLWVLKLITNATGSISRGRNRRLAVVDSVQVDPRRRVVIIRRDNTEHVIMTGGPQDVVIESGIPVEKVNLRRPGQAAGPAVESRAVPQAAAGRTPMDRLRENGRPLPQRKGPPLRSSGVGRTVGRLEPAVIPINGYNSDVSAADSAKTSPTTETNGQAKLGAASTNHFFGDAFKSEGK